MRKEPMPKREENYMAAQREHIARAALTILLEKGLYATTLRDICRAAGISIGALYIHFATKEEAVVAACALDFFDREGAPPAKTWQAYIDNFFSMSLKQSGSRISKRFRLSLQLVAEMTQFATNPPGLSHIFELYRSEIEKNLVTLQGRGEVSLPLGLDDTVNIHTQLFLGAEYQLASNREVNTDHIRYTLEKGLAVIAGHGST